MQALRRLLGFDQGSSFVLKSNLFTCIISVTVYCVLLYVHIFDTPMWFSFCTNSVRDRMFMNGWTYTAYQRCHDMCSVTSQMFQTGCPLNRTMPFPRNSWVTVTSSVILWHPIFVFSFSSATSHAYFQLPVSVIQRTPVLQLIQLVNTATQFADLIATESGKCSFRASGCAVL